MKKFKWPLVVFLGMIAGVFFFFDHFYNRSVRALVDFSASYDKFNKAVSDLSVSKTDDLESKAGAALIELKMKAGFRLSSLIKNDGELMTQAFAVADLSERELASLEAYRRAVQNKDAKSDDLAREYGDFAGKRKAAFARFRGLGGSKD